MATSSWQTTVTTALASGMDRHKWSRRRTLAMSAAVLLALYVSLLWATGGNAATAPQAEGPTLPALPQPAVPPQPATEPTPAASADGAVSPALLAEFDRLASNQGAVATDGFGESAQNPSGIVGTMTLSLLLILGAVYAGVWLYKRRGTPSGTDGLLPDGRLLAVQESQSIGPNQKLHLVRMGDELLLIAATEQNITFLARYDGETANDSFADHLRSAITPGSGQKSAGLDLNEGLQRLRGYTRSGIRGGGDD